MQPASNAACEDRWVEARVDRVEDRVHPFGPCELGDRGGVGRVDGRGAEALVAVRLDRAARARSSSTSAKHHPLEEAATLRNRGNRSSHSPGPDDENAHGRVHAT